MSNKEFQILIVDDTLQNLQLLGEILKPQGYRLHFAQDGMQALEKLEQIKPDLILLDVMMPNMSGYEVCERVMADLNLREIPIIFLTAKVDQEDIVKGFQLGAVDYITKPFNSTELLHRVQTHISLYQNQQLLKQANYEQKKLLHVLTHDLLNSVGGALSLLDSYKLGITELDVSLDFIKEYLTRATDLIELNRQRLALAEGKYTLELAPIQLKETLEASIRMLFLKFEKKEIEIILEVPPKLTVLAESVSLINSVFNNLLSNALKFSYPKSQVLIRGFEQGEQILVELQDFGTGIRQEIMDHMFDPAKSQSMPGTEKESGTGFGMPLIKDFMEAYGGSIEISTSLETADETSHGTLATLTFLPG